MNALVVINSSGQDLELGGAFNAAMKQKQWRAFERMPSAYAKSFASSDSPESMARQARADVEFAVGEAEWENVNYLFIATESTAQEGVAK